MRDLPLRPGHQPGDGLPHVGGPRPGVPCGRGDGRGLLGCCLSRSLLGDRGRRSAGGCADVVGREDAVAADRCEHPAAHLLGQVAQVDFELVGQALRPGGEPERVVLLPVRGPQDVIAGDASVRTRARDSGQVDAEVGRDPAYQRSDGRLRRRVRRHRAGGGDRSGGLLGSLGRLGVRPGGAPVPDPGQWRPDRHLVADRHQQLLHDTFGEDLDLHGRLRGVDHRDDVSLADGVAGLDQPLEHGALGHVGTERRHHEVSHGGVPGCGGRPPRCRRPRGGRRPRGAWGRAAGPRRCTPARPVRRGRTSPARRPG